jgi:hypothetical protein
MNMKMFSRALELTLFLFAGLGATLSWAGCHLSGGQCNSRGTNCDYYKFFDSNGVEFDVCNSRDAQYCQALLSSNDRCHGGPRKLDCKLWEVTGSMYEGGRKFQFLDPDGHVLGNCNSSDYNDCYNRLFKLPECRVVSSLDPALIPEYIRVAQIFDRTRSSKAEVVEGTRKPDSNLSIGTLEQAGNMSGVLSTASASAQ